jgi:hypothetical protein
MLVTDQVSGAPNQPTGAVKVAQLLTLSQRKIKNYNRHIIGDIRELGFKLLVLGNGKNEWDIDLKN